ncbi:apoptosis regulator BAX-like [Eurytemora carolleeae]|uniref:apoptosis regulator BAX-like n=1 Tax=Eurytemora carolleeae TaxID=1294199 RepID=UPI000C76563B|nr:apoptosis regulator BAX-like [Eurytemora carolleeae]|eukprot:XP_023335127.1 apoptosis regulator BAX-like [Eurytemora affinis]
MSGANVIKVEVDEDEERGVQLYGEFLSHNLERENLPGLVNLRLPQVQDSLNYDLARLAEVFSQSEERDLVRQRAEEIDLESLSTENFLSLINELFHDGGITQERVLVLFFFCSDLTIRACRAGLGSLCLNITNWTLGFLRRTVAVWVRVQGGWSKVLRGQGSYSDTMLVIGSSIIIISFILYYRRRT